jgi:hypothetical protein
MIRQSLFCISMVYAIVACSDDKTAFETGTTNYGTKKKPNSENVQVKPSSQTASGEKLGAAEKESFKVTQSAGKVDIVWVVDQSGSMQQETQNVQRNLKDFISKVDAKIDARHALIASRTRGFALDIDAIGIASEKVKQIDREVASRDALVIAASAFTRSGATLPPGISSGYSGIQGSLFDFFRPGVRPIVVVVTDDNASGVNQTNFMEIVSNKDNSIGIKPLVFAFAGRVAQNEVPQNLRATCSIAAKGTAYLELAEKSTPKAEVFDICQQDWTESFKKLTEGVFVAAENSFRLKKPARRIVKVLLNGAQAEPSQYTYAAGVLTVLPEALNNLGETRVEVEYQP